MRSFDVDRLKKKDEEQAKKKRKKNDPSVCSFKY